jgi:hypothetical protein
MRTVRSSVVQQQACCSENSSLACSARLPGWLLQSRPWNRWFDAIRTLLFQASSHRRGGGELDHVHPVLRGRGVRVAVDVEGDARISEGDLVAE